MAHSKSPYVPYLALHRYVTELTEYIKIKSPDEVVDDSEFVKFFPSFIWAVRDFTLQRNINGKDATDDEYLDFALKLKLGNIYSLSSLNIDSMVVYLFSCYMGLQASLRWHFMAPSRQGSN